MDRVVATRAPDQMPIRPYAVTLPSGAAEERYWSAANAPVLGPDGAVTHIVSAVRDATGEVLERRSEEARTLLMREVDHRARNALTVVQSFVRLTDAPTLEDFRQVLDGRVEALARAQTSLAARRWEGATLVVETANLNGLTHLTFAPSRSTDQTTVAERFTLVEPDTLQYEATISDPGTWTRPWTMAFPRKRRPNGVLYEYACHEGNYGLPNILSASRTAEKSASR